MSLYRNVFTGVDLDSVFAARVSAPTTSTGFRNLDGQDLNMRYEPYNGVDPTTPVGYRGPDGRDLSLYFSTSAGVPVNFTGYGRGENNAPSSTATANIVFTTDGRVTGSGIPIGSGDISSWFSSPRAGVGDDYDVFVDTMSAGLGTPSGTFNTWLQLNANRQFVLSITGNAETARTSTAQIRRRSDNVVVCSGSLLWEARAGIPA